MRKNTLPSLSTNKINYHEEFRSEIGTYDSKQNSDNDKKVLPKVEYQIYKYSDNNHGSLCESILVDNRPYFLEIAKGRIIELLDRIEISDKIALIPPQDITQYLSKEYSFSDTNEIQRYIKRAKKETISSLFIRLKTIWKKYFDINDYAITLCTADTLFTYFQDKLGMTHYLLFVGDNSTGKSNALKIFNLLGYRSIFDTAITAANVYNFLDRIEEGQCTILEDEIDNIELEQEKMRIYKGGYVSGTRVTRIYESPNNPGSKRKQHRFYTYCFKAFTSERYPSFFKAKGFNERILTINCTSGNPLYDISEVENDAGDPAFKKLEREIEDTRKLLFIYRLLNHDKAIPDIQLSIKNRDKQLCKPLLRLFQNSDVVDEVKDSLSHYISEKKNRKLNSLDSFLYSLLMDRCDHSGGNLDNCMTIPNETLWNVVLELQGSTIPGKPHSYQTDEFGIVSKTQITKICEDKFGAKKGHDGKQRCLIFNKDMIERLKDNYSTIDKIEILYRNNSNQFSDNNTFNTFNTFWNSLDKIKAGDKRSGCDNVNENSYLSHYNNETSRNTNEKLLEDNSKPNEVNASHPEKVLEPLKVLESQESRKIKDNTMTKKSDYILYFDSRKENSENDKTQVRNDSEVGYKDPFYFCKKHPTIQNIHREEIVRHIQLSYLHWKSDENKLTKGSELEDGQK